MRFFKISLYVAIFSRALFISGSLCAQAGGDYPIVNEVSVDFSGFQSVSEELVLSNVQLRKGMDYNATLVDQSIRTLYSTGLFEFVEVRVETISENAINVIFEVIPKYRVSQVIFEGNQKYSQDRLLDESELQKNVPLDEYQVSEGAANVQAYYVKKGYKDVTIDYRIQRDETTGEAVVVFDVDEDECECDEVIVFYLLFAAFL